MTYSPGVSGLLRAPARLRTRANLVLLAGLALVAVQLAFRGWAVYGSWFQFDDVVFISRLYDRSWSWDLVGHGFLGPKREPDLPAHLEGRPGSATVQKNAKDQKP